MYAIMLHCSQNFKKGELCPTDDAMMMNL